MYIQNREKIEKLLSNLVKELVKQDIIEGNDQTRNARS